MNDDAIRALVREAIARLEARGGQASAPDATPIAGFASHPSNFTYPLTPSDGPCVIEPKVPCNHCGYCLSHGH